MGRGYIRLAVTGCLGLLTLLVLGGFAIFLFKPKLFRQGFDWMLYKPPPALAAVDAGGTEQTERFFREIIALSLRNTRFVGRAELSERHANAYLLEILRRSKGLQGLEQLQVDFLNDRIDLYATVNPAEMDKSDQLRELGQVFPPMLRDHRTSLLIKLEQPRVENRRYAFRQVSMYVGRLPLPFSGHYLKPLLRFLPGGDFTALTLSNGIPVPPRTKVTITPDKIEVSPTQ